jgi:hypothetical protein
VLACLAATCAGLLRPATVSAEEQRTNVTAPGEGWFQQALALDIGVDGPRDAAGAYGLMLRAAEAGHPQAAFNVAAMLDNGRGAPPDAAQAEIWYARAAARGNVRAAYNLGLIYAGGSGAAANGDLSRAWFVASGLPAARDRLAQPAPSGPRSTRLVSPRPLFPTSGTTLDGDARTVELVWTCEEEPEPVSFFVEVRVLDETGSREAWTGFTDVSSTSLSIPADAEHFAWRVSAVARSAASYASSGWTVAAIGARAYMAEARRGGEQR